MSFAHTTPRSPSLSARGGLAIVLTDVGLVRGVDALGIVPGSARRLFHSLRSCRRSVQAGKQPSTGFSVGSSVMLMRRSRG